MPTVLVTEPSTSTVPLGVGTDKSIPVTERDPVESMSLLDPFELLARIPSSWRRLDLRMPQASGRLPRLPQLSMSDRSALADSAPVVVTELSPARRANLIGRRIVDPCRFGETVIATDGADSWHNHGVSPCWEIQYSQLVEYVWRARSGLKNVLVVPLEL